ncbi:hypothetical protein BRW64_02495 [Mycolicibacterium diernhoferi]|uniref:Uncharacterized protein n=1 Tax=Mycolicibacterium diernhoferi TaxID=1801 RepID=A0A1Q4HLQ0_9MYCO|nr:hypothetical protein BRW64_02495 [Mycolicibacterium diernhoferi]OPE53163.1 hypothetical protein BV510_17010 [Mycolicibacterium diernhoferi]PEG52097.1 hypothetical protein CRI78_23455 [Mycolicibacterium diernhoferi]
MLVTVARTALDKPSLSADSENGSDDRHRFPRLANPLCEGDLISVERFGSTNRQPAQLASGLSSVSTLALQLKLD